MTRYHRPPIPANLRRQVYERDHGICCDCGAADPKWHADHDIPLWKADGLDDEWFESLENVKTALPAMPQAQDSPGGRGARKVQADRPAAWYEGKGGTGKGTNPVLGKETRCP